MDHYNDSGDTEMPERFHMVVIGSGPAGVRAASKAAHFGKDVLIIEQRKRFGGPTGLHSKAFREAALKLNLRKNKGNYANNVDLWTAVMDVKREVVNLEADVVKQKLIDDTVWLENGRGQVVDANTIKVVRMDGSSTDVKTDFILVATGSRAMHIAPLGIPFGPRVYDSDTINKLPQYPVQGIVITGAGIIGLEYAMIFAELGCKVTLLVREKNLEEANVRIGFDGDLAEMVTQRLANMGVEVRFETTTDNFLLPDDVNDWTQPIVITLSNGDTLLADAYLFCAGRVANTEKMGLDTLGVKLARGGYVEVDSKLCSAVPNIFACGDVIGPPSLASTGVEQASVAVGYMFNKWSRGRPPAESYDPFNILAGSIQFPVGVWTLPEIAWVGATEVEAKKHNLNYGVGRATYDQCLRARVNEEQEGFLKLVFNKEDQVIAGIVIFGAQACEMIHFGLMLVRAKYTLSDMLTTVLAAVTFHEMFKLAAANGVEQLVEEKRLQMLKSNQSGKGSEWLYRRQSLKMMQTIRALVVDDTATNAPQSGTMPLNRTENGIKEEPGKEAAEKEAGEKAAAEKEAAEKAAAEKAATEKVAAEKAASDTKAAEVKAVLEMVATQKIAAEKLAQASEGSPGGLVAQVNEIENQLRAVKVMAAKYEGVPVPPEKKSSSSVCTIS